MENSEKLVLIEGMRNIILHIQDVNDKIYNDLIERLKLEKHTQEEEHLFDLVYNTPDQEDFKAGITWWFNRHNENYP